MACARSTHHPDGGATTGDEDNWYGRQAMAGEPNNTTQAYQIKGYLRVSRGSCALNVNVTGQHQT